jgi:hypothetical protein
MLKAGEAALAAAFVEKGSSGEGQAETAEAEIDKLAKKLAEDTKVTYAKAYEQVLQSNPALYQKAEKERTQKVAKAQSGH